MNIRNLTTRPGFEFIFSVGIAAIFILPAAVMAQDNKNIEITITNGDTVINGKNIKELSPDQRAEAMSDIKKISGKGQYKEYRFERRTNNGGPHMAPPPPPTPPAADGLGYSDLNIVHTPSGYTVSPDRGNDGRQLHVKRTIRRDTVLAFTFQQDNRRPKGDFITEDHPQERMEMFTRRNTQEFDYTNVDNDGVETGVNFRVSEPKGERLKGIIGIDKADLTISDLKIIPDFVSGKTLIMFSLPTKAIAEVELLDNTGKVLWNDKASSGAFSKNFAMPLNGVYNLKIKQSGKMAVKQIFKEE